MKKRFIANCLNSCQMNVCVCDTTFMSLSHNCKVDVKTLITKNWVNQDRLQCHSTRNVKITYKCNCTCLNRHHQKKKCPQAFLRESLSCHFLFMHFIGLVKQCKLREERNYDYKKLIKIDDIPGIKPNGYLVRLPVYILAARDAHIVFSAKESPNWTRDYVYEICKRMNITTIFRRIFNFRFIFIFVNFSAWRLGQQSYIDSPKETRLWCSNWTDV